MPEFQKPPRLNIKCTSADCENELHCFKQLKKMTEEQRGKCRYGKRPKAPMKRWRSNRFMA